MAMIVMTTSSSIRVKALCFIVRWGLLNRSAGKWARPSSLDRQLTFQLKRGCRQRRQLDQNRMFTRHPGDALALHATVIANVTAAVGFRVGVDDLAIKSRVRYAESIV